MVFCAYGLPVLPCLHSEGCCLSEYLASCQCFEHRENNVAFYSLSSRSLIIVYVKWLC